MDSAYPELPSAQPDLPDYDALRAAVQLPDDVVCAFWSGSVVAGWGHRHSDLDAYVICRGAPNVPSDGVHLVAVEPITVPSAVAEIGDWRVDAEFWMESQVDQLLERLAAWRTQERGRPSATDHERIFLYRLSIAQAMHGEEWLAGRKRALAEAGLPIIFAERALDRADHFLEDAAGLLASGDLPSAVLAARDAFNAVVDALVCQEGEISLIPKWRARRLIAAQPASLSWEQYWTRETMRDFDPDNPEQWVLDTIQICQDLMMDVEIPE